MPRHPAILGLLALLIAAALAPSATAQTGLRLNGSSQYATFGAAASLGSPTFTLECWFKREGAGVATSTGTGGATAIPLIAKGRGEADGDTRDMNYFLGIRASDGMLVADYEEGTGQTSPGLNHPIAGATPVQTGVWAHAAATFDGRRWRLYLNGVLEKDTLMSTGRLPQSASIQHAALGTAITSTGSAAGFFQGTLDEARIWNVARSAQGIGDSLGLQIASAPGLAGRWALDVVNGGQTPTSIAGGIAGTIVGGAVTAPGAPFAVVPARAPNAPVLVSPANGAQAPTPASLSVGVSDPDGGNLSVTFYGRVASAGGSAGPDFTLIGLPDTQYYTSSLNGGTPAMFDAQTQWIVANRAARNIVGVIQLGDCTQNGDNGGNPAEWLNADRSIRFLEDSVTTQLRYGIPFGVCVGNHDQSPGGNADGTTTFFNQYFGVARFQGRPYYGGHYGSNNDNHYELFSASGLDFIVICFEYDPTPDAAVLAWADNLLTTYANRRAIVASHYLIDAGNPGPFGAQGQAVYNALKGHANLFLMLCGHVTPPEGRRSDTYNGRTVHTVLSDYQNRTRGGDGWLRIYEFSPAHNVIRVRTYSPTLGQFEADADSSSQFTLAYDMGGTTPFQTIATSTVASGANATLSWAGLLPNTTYEWYAVVSDGARAATGPTWRFTTGASANLVANSGFESGLSGWTRYGTPTLTQGSEGHSGARSLQIRGSSTSTSAFGCDDSPNAVTTVAGVGAVYRFSAWVKTPATSRGRARLRVYELLGSVQQGSTVYSPELTLASGWQLLTVDHTVRTAGSTLSLRVVDTPVAGGETFLVDDVSVTLVGAPAVVSGGGAEPMASAASPEAAVTLSAVVAPNPMARRGALEFVLPHPGPVRAELFDASGRRVRRLLDKPSLEAGRHRVALDSHRDGASLAAGVYFYRLESADGMVHGRFVVIE